MQEEATSSKPVLDPFLTPSDQDSEASDLSLPLQDTGGWRLLHSQASDKHSHTSTQFKDISSTSNQQSLFSEAEAFTSPGDQDNRTLLYHPDSLYPNSNSNSDDIIQDGAFSDQSLISFDKQTDVICSAASEDGLGAHIGETDSDIKNELERKEKSSIYDEFIDSD